MPTRRFHLFTLDWSADRLRVIGEVERLVRDHETLAVAMPRGSGDRQADSAKLTTGLAYLLPINHQLYFACASSIFYASCRRSLTRLCRPEGSLRFGWASTILLEKGGRRSCR